MKSSKIYFQTQSQFSNKCGICALNNLLGWEQFNTKDLNNICKPLSNDFINPYKSIFGGDYDVTALIIALQGIGLKVQWYKKEQKIKQIMSRSQFYGFLINTELKGSLLYKVLNKQNRHWTCMKKKDDKFIYMDSQQNEPEVYQKLQQAENRIQEIKQFGGIILVVGE